MNINVNIKSSTIKEIESELKRKNIMYLNLTQVPFHKFTVTISNEMTLNRAMDKAKIESEGTYKNLDAFSLMQLANKLLQEYNSTQDVVTYEILKDKVIMTSKDFEITQYHTGSFALPCEIKSDVIILAEDLIEELETYTLYEKNNFMIKMAECNLSILMAVLYTLSNTRNEYEIVEKESTKIKSSIKKKKVKSNKNKITYIKHKDINIVKKKSINTYTEHTSYTRHIDSWVTRGHWRTYKSGKKIWIKERINNVNKIKSKEVSKTYEII